MKSFGVSNAGVWRRKELPFSDWKDNEKKGETGGSALAMLQVKWLQDLIGDSE